MSIQFSAFLFAIKQITYLLLLYSNLAALSVKFGSSTVTGKSLDSGPAFHPITGAVPEQ